MLKLSFDRNNPPRRRELAPPPNAMQIATQIVHQLRAKSLDPRQGPGWEVLSGIPNWLSANEIWQKMFPQELEATIRNQVTVYSCVRKICLSAQEAPLRIGYDTPQGWKDVPNHFVQDLLRQPNPQMSGNEFSWRVISHLQLTGESYIWKIRNKAKYIAEMWPIPTSMVEPVRDSQGRVDHYLMWQGPQKDKLPIPLTDITRILFPDPSNLGRGLGPLQAAIRDVQTDGQRGDYIAEMLTNCRTPGLIVKQAMGWSEEQKDEIRNIINDGLGRGRRGKALFLEGDGAEITQGAPLSDLDWPGLSNLSETRICSAFDVPPIIIGLRSGLESATYSNFETALRAFYGSNMVPLWSLLDSAFTRGLLRDEGYDDPLEIYHDITKVRGLQEDDDKRAERAAKLLGAGIITRNEAREMIGEEPLPNARGDVFLIPMSMVEEPANEAAQPEEPPKDDGAPDQPDPANPDPANKGIPAAPDTSPTNTNATPKA